MRKKRFTILLDEQERRLITQVAEQLNRSQGDVLRFLVRIAAQELNLSLEKSTHDNLQPQEESCLTS